MNTAARFTRRGPDKPDFDKSDCSSLTGCRVEVIVMLVGYDGKMYYFNDPWEHHGRIGYPKEVVEARHRAQYEMAVTAYRA